MELPVEIWALIASNSAEVLGKLLLTIRGLDKYLAPFLTPDSDFVRNLCVTIYGYDGEFFRESVIPGSNKPWLRHGLHEGRISRKTYVFGVKHGLCTRDDAGVAREVYWEHGERAWGFRMGCYHLPNGILATNPWRFYPVGARIGSRRVTIRKSLAHALGALSKVKVDDWKFYISDTIELRRGGYRIRYNRSFGRDFGSFSVWFSRNRCWVTAPGTDLFLLSLDVVSVTANKNIRIIGRQGYFSCRIGDRIDALFKRDGILCHIRKEGDTTVVNFIGDHVSQTISYGRSNNTYFTPGRREVYIGNPRKSGYAFTHTRNLLLIREPGYFLKIRKKNGRIKHDTLCVHNRLRGYARGLGAFIDGRIVFKEDLLCSCIKWRGQ